LHVLFRFVVLICAYWVLRFTFRRRERKRPMLACSHCGVPIHESSQYCSACGTKAVSPLQLQARPDHQTPYYPPQTHVPSAARGFGLIFFGLDPRVAFLTLIIDLMLFGGEGLTGGLLVAVAVPAGIVLGFITYLAQTYWYGDDRVSATIKGLIVALLTAIPTALPAIFYISFSGLLGLRHTIRKK